MSVSRTLVIGELHAKLYRRTRPSNGARYGVCTIRDRDRLETRFWKVYVDELELIEKIESMRLGECLAVSGPFSIGANGDLRISAYAVIDPYEKRKPKTKKQIRAEECVVSNETDEAPRDGMGSALDDPLPF